MLLTPKSLDYRGDYAARCILFRWSGNVYFDAQFASRFFFRNGIRRVVGSLGVNVWPQFAQQVLTGWFIKYNQVIHIANGVKER